MAWLAMIVLDVHLIRREKEGASLSREQCYVMMY